MYGGELSLKEWQLRLDKLNAELEVRIGCNELSDYSWSEIMQVSRTEDDPLGLVDSAMMASTQSEQPTSESTANKDDDDMENSVNSENQTRSSTETAEDMELDTDNDVSPIPKQTATEEGDNNNDDEDDVPLAKAISAAPTRPKTIISAEKMQQLTLMKTFLVDAVKFIEQIHKSIPIVVQLLSSKSKLEVVEAMDFFMTAYLYKISAAKVKAVGAALDTTVLIPLILTVFFNWLETSRMGSGRCCILFGSKIPVTKERGSN